MEKGLYLLAFPMLMLPIFADIQEFTNERFSAGQIKNLYQFTFPDAESKKIILSLGFTMLYVKKPAYAYIAFTNSSATFNGLVNEQIVQGQDCCSNVKTFCSLVDGSKPWSEFPDEKQVIYNSTIVFSENEGSFFPLVQEIAVKSPGLCYVFVAFCGEQKTSGSSPVLILQGSIAYSHDSGYFSDENSQTIRVYELLLAITLLLLFGWSVLLYIYKSYLCRLHYFISAIIIIFTCEIGTLVLSAMHENSNGTKSKIINALFYILCLSKCILCRVYAHFLTVAYGYREKTQPIRDKILLNILTYSPSLIFYLISTYEKSKWGWLNFLSYLPLILSNVLVMYYLSKLTTSTIQELEEAKEESLQILPKTMRVIIIGAGLFGSIGIALEIVLRLYLGSNVYMFQQWKLEVYWILFYQVGLLMMGLVIRPNQMALTEYKEKVWDQSISRRIEEKKEPPMIDSLYQDELELN